MKHALIFLLLIFSLSAMSQSKEEIAVLANTRALHTAVFETKDSVTLEKLFSGALSYGHSGGRVESKEDAIRGVVNNKSRYADLEIEGSMYVSINGNTAVTRHTMKANEHTGDGKINPLKLHIVLVWTKEKKEWKLMARQAVKPAG